MNEKKRKEFVVKTSRSIFEACINNEGDVKLSDLVFIILEITNLIFDFYSKGDKIKKSDFYKKLIFVINKIFIIKEENEA